MKLAWSVLAVQDLRDIRRHSVARWGREIALRYVQDVRDIAKRVAINPQSARLLRGNLHTVRVRSHHMIVHVDQGASVVTIARLLHTAMDLERHLP